MEGFMRRFMVSVAIAAALACSVVSAQAQSADPVAAQYQAYTTALAAGDRAGAERAAAAALQASEARDGDGGQTGPLAANLAQIRLDLNRPADAVAPAQKALQIAERTNGAAVNLTYARMLVGMAELSTDGDAGQRRILAALNDARNQPGIAAESYEASVTLGEWAIRNDRAQVARDAFERAQTFQLGQTDADNTLRARAMVGQALALTMLEQSATRRNRTGTRLAVAPDNAPSELFAQALRLAKPIAEREARTGRVTRAQVAYGVALAWTHARSARLAAMDWMDRAADVSDRRGMVIDMMANDSLAACPISLDPSPVPAYSEEGIRAAGANAVVVRVITDSSGNITDRRLVGAAGDQEFVTSINDVLPQWTAPAGQNCSKARVMFVPVLVLPNDEQVAESFRAESGAQRANVASMMMAGYQAGQTGAGTWLQRQSDGLIALVPQN
jgi:hypothetical protein